jgi:uncharacterized protein
VRLRSSLHVGSVRHRRLHPRRHHFRYRAFWMLLDLSEVDQLSHKLRWFSYNRPNLFSLYDSDHGDGTSTPLRAQIERRLHESGIDLAHGRVLLLCMPRTLGYCFNPLSVFFCHRGDGALMAIIYEVHNTFRERHSYIIAVDRPGHAIHQQCRKLFYVSPFMEMGMRYDFHIVGPDARIVVDITASGAKGRVLHAVLRGTRHPLTDWNLARMFLKLPAITLKVMAAIHWEALKLWAKRIRMHPRPAPPQRMATHVTEASAALD